MADKRTAQADLTLYKRLLVYVKPYWLVFIISTLALTLFSAMNAAFFDLFGMLIAHIGKVSGQGVSLEGMDIPSGMGGIVSGAGEAANNSILVKIFGDGLGDAISQNGQLAIPLLFVAVAMVRGFGFFIGTYGMAYIGSYLVHNLRTDVFNKMTRLPTSYFDRNMSGHLVSRLTYNVTQVTEAVNNAVKTIITEGSQVIVYLGLMLFYNWQLTVLFLVVMPLIGVVVQVVSKRFRRISHRIQSAQGNVTQVSQEMISGFRVMRIFAGEQYERQRMNAASEDNRHQVVKMGAVQGMSSPVVQLIISVVMALLIFFALSPYMVNNIELNSLIMFLLVAGALTRPVRKLTSVMAPIQKGLAAAQSIFQTLDAKEEVDTGVKTLDKVRGHFVFDGVSFAYNDTDGPVINNLSFEVKAGETVALVGSSGSGKSTLVSLIPRFYNHTSGSILLDGMEIEDLTLANLRSHISFVNQQVTLFNDTAYNNIAYGDLASLPREQVIEAARAAHALEFIEAMPQGFDTVIGDNGSKLSGGQRQRLVIARALLKQCPILILDEATSALDTDSERHIQAALEELMKGRTTFVIAHRLSTIENANRIIVLEKGEIVEQGTHQSLLDAGGRYAQLHSSGFEAEQ